MNLNEMVIRTSMRNMFSRGHVDICAIKECLKLAGITPVGPELAQLSALHCISFKDMDRELAVQVPAMVAKVFDGMHLAVDDMFKRPEVRPGQIVEITPPPAPKSGVMRLLGFK